MSDKLITDLPKFKGTEVLLKAAENHKDSPINGMGLKGDSQIILGLCSIIQDLSDRLDCIEDEM